MDSRIKRTATAIAVATVLAMPGVALAQTDAEKALEARVAELEKLVQQMSAQQAAAPATTAAQPAEEKKAPEPTVKTGGGEMLTIKGFIIGSLYAQDANFTFGNGQNAEFPSSEFGRNSWLLSGDVRNTRVTFGFNGPDVAGMKVGGTLELDFFGGFNGAGAFSDEQPVPRLRLAYADVTKGDTTFRVGQAWSPLFGNVPVSPTHVAFPLGYGSAGDVGWRFPGLFIYHNINKDLKLTFAAMRGSWSAPASTLESQSAGESGTPQFEARVDYAGKNWSVYGVGHYDQKDCRGTGTTPTACAGNGTKDKMNGTAVEVGAKFGVGAFSFQGNVYQGTAIGQQFGAITQFGNIDSWGGWAQASVKMGPKWSAHLFYGMEDPKDEDVLNSGNKRVKNEQVALSTMYSTGPYVFGLEWMNSKLTNGTRDSETGGIDTSSIKGNQISASVWYKF
jgi:uncharacterized membrane protein